MPTKTGVALRQLGISRMDSEETVASKVVSSPCCAKTMQRLERTCGNGLGGLPPGTTGWECGDWASDGGWMR